MQDFVGETLGNYPLGGPKRKWDAAKWKMIGNGSRSCPKAGFGTRVVEPSGSPIQVIYVTTQVGPLKNMLTIGGAWI
jgi:hypothetical protein